MYATQQHTHTASIRWDAADYADNSSVQYQWGCELIDSLDLGG